MATKPQAKSTIDAAVVLIKNEIDTILPVGVNISDGRIEFTPTKLYITIDAGGSESTAETLMTQITTNLTTASRASSIKRNRRTGDDTRHFLIFSALTIFKIINF
jgi:hypothetical protein